MSVSLIHAEGVNLTKVKQLTCQQYYPSCETCTKNQFLLPFAKFSNLTDTLEFEADESEIIDNDNYLITGNVELKSDSHFLSADKVEISKTDQSSKASGNVKYQDMNLFLISDELNIQKENDGLIIKVDKSSYQDINSKANGSAEKVLKTLDYAILDESTYSMCPINDNTWYVKAKKIHFNFNTNRVTADQASFIFFDFPIFYLPKYSWIREGRGSGFLTPSFNIYKESGLQSNELLIKAPYYINIAPDKDLLISLGYLSSRGAVYEGRYRQLIDPSKSQDHGLFTFEFKYLFNDYITNLNRWLVDTTVELDLSDKTHFNLRYNRASDSEFLSQIARVGSADERLNSHVKFTYNNPPLPLTEGDGVEALTKSDLEKLSDSELILKTIDSGNTDKIEFGGSDALDPTVPSYKKELANREELIEVLIALIEGKALNEMSGLEKLSDKELILKAIDSGIRDKIEFAGSQALDHDIPSYEKDLANREELIGVLAGLIEAKALTKSHPEKLSLEKLSDAGLTKAKLSDAVDEEQITTVNYGRNIIGNANTNQLSFAISSEDEQVVNAGEPNYVKNLETSFFSRSRGNNSKLDLGLISTNFNHKTTGKDTGIRTHGEVNFNKKLGSRLSTDTKLALSHYALDNKTNETRVVGGFDIDLSFPFSRKSTLFGSETTNQIIPRISYDFASKEKQASIPIFDTTDRIDGYLDYSSLLSGERYSSFDRVVNENDITLGLQSFYKDKLDKKTNLTFTLAQRYYGDDEVVSDTENIDFETRSKYSDIFTSAELTINDFSTYAKLQYNPKNFNLTKSRIGFNYELHPRNFITLALADDGSERDLNITGAYPISNRLHIFGGIDKTLSSGVLNKETTGVAYESCCWSARLAHFKTSAGVGYDYSTGFELVFKGLGTTDSYVRDRIKVNLPEYQVMID